MPSSAPRGIHALLDPQPYAVQTFFIGLVSILAQVVILRELSVAFFGVELIYLLALGVWLLWTAVGALGGSRNDELFVARIRTGFTLAAVVLPLDIVFTRAIRVLFSDVAGAYLPFPVQASSMALALFPMALILGLLFRWTARAYIAGGGTLAAAYAIESTGGLLGGLLGTLFLKVGIRNLAAALICTLLCLVAAQLGASRGRVVLHRLNPVRVFLAGAVAVVLWNVSWVDFVLTAWTHTDLLNTRDSPYGRITLTRSGGEVSVFENDVLSFNTEGTAAEEFVHVAALQHPGPVSVLVVGGGVEGIVREALLHHPRSVQYVELNPVLLDMARRYLPHLFAPHPEFVTGRASKTHVLLVTEDPRVYVRTTTASYDLILVGMAEPSSGQANRYFTREFFQECRARLTGSGVLALRLPSSENLWTPQLARRNASIYQALRFVYRDVVVVPGATAVFLASMQPLVRDPGMLIERFAARRIRARLVSPPYLRYVYTNDRFSEAERILTAERVPVNTDARPVSYGYTAMIWLSKFYPRLSNWATARPGAGAEPALMLGIAVLGALFMIGRWRPNFGRALLAGIAGFLGMVLETVLILQYQVGSGILYQDFGILLMSFMAGLALGAMAIDRGSLWRRPGASILPWGLSLLGGFVVLCASMAWQITQGSGPGLLLTSFELAFAGFLVAGVFAYASLVGLKQGSEVVGTLYAADLAGGCLGCIAAALFMIPMLGLAATALWMIPLVLATALLIH